MSTASDDAKGEPGRSASSFATDLTGFVLAGGRSLRMGRDKALLEWGSGTLLDHMIRLAGTVAHPVMTVGRHPLPDKLPGLGPLSGIATGLEAASTDANLFIAVDLPLLTTGFLNYFRSRILRAAEPIVVCKIESGFPLCLGVWRPILPEIQTRLHSRRLSVRALIEESNAAEVIFETELAAHGFQASMFRNINTEEDYRLSKPGERRN